MRLTTLALASLLLTGCTYVERHDSTTTTTTAPFHFCRAFKPAGNGTFAYDIVGCPVEIGHTNLNATGRHTYHVPDNATGLMLNLTIQTASVGALQLSVVAGPYQWNLSFAGPYLLNDQSEGGLLPNHVTDATLHFDMSVCHIQEASLAVNLLGSYGTSNATLSAYVYQSFSVEGKHFEGLDNTSTCNGAWTGKPVLPEASEAVR
jgi:hypothetical protein